MDCPNQPSFCVLGSGPAGLITAYTLIQDGFENVMIFTRGSSPGGVWAAERVYPEMTINNIHGEYRFSSLPMPPPRGSSKTGGRLTGDDLQAYFESFTDRFLNGKIQYNTEVQRICRSHEKPGWQISTQDLKTGKTSELHFDKFVLCSGGCSEPKIPSNLSPGAAKQTGFTGPVVHSFYLATQLASLLDTVKPLTDPNPGHILVIGGGKSAQDVASTFALEGRKVSALFETLDGFLAGPSPLPDFIRKSRLFSICTPHIELRTRLERFLHSTWLGGMVIRRLWRSLISGSFKALNVPETSPLRNTHSIFWSVLVNDEGVADSQRFHGLVTRGKIELIAPARAVGYVKSGIDPSGPTVSLETTDGQLIKANAVVVCTGFASSWAKLFDDETRAQLGLKPVPVPCHDSDEFNYVTLSNPPASHHQGELKIIPLYRGLVPAMNILKRDFVLNGTVYSTNFGYTIEVQAHWISSYFLNDSFLQLPSTPEEAIKICDRYNSWWTKRYPGMLPDTSENFSGGYPFLNWPQAADTILEDMGLRSMRSGGNWLTWPFKVIDLKEIENLHQERMQKRRRLSSAVDGSQ